MSVPWSTAFHSRERCWPGRSTLTRGIRIGLTSASTIVPHAAPIITPTAPSTTWPVHAHCVHASQRDHVGYVGTPDALCGIGGRDTTRVHGVILDALALLGG